MFQGLVNCHIIGRAASCFEAGREIIAIIEADDITSGRAVEERQLFVEIGTTKKPDAQEHDRSAQQWADQLAGDFGRPNENDCLRLNRDLEHGPEDAGQGQSRCQHAHRKDSRFANEEEVHERRNEYYVDQEQ